MADRFPAAALGARLPPGLVALIVLLVAYGNVVSLAGAEMPVTGGWTGIVIGLAPAAVMLVWGRKVAGLTAGDLGLRWPGTARSVATGLVVALVGAGAALIVLRFPPIIGNPVVYAPLGGLSFEALLWRALWWMPLDTALPEEFVFRGVLLAVLIRRWSAPTAMLMSAIPFTLWHGVIVTRTVSVTNLQADPFFVLLGLVGAFTAVFVGGILFAALRLATGHLGGSIVAHWVFNAALLVGLYDV